MLHRFRQTGCLVDMHVCASEIRGNRGALETLRISTLSTILQGFTVFPSIFSINVRVTATSRPTTISIARVSRDVGINMGSGWR